MSWRLLRGLAACLLALALPAVAENVNPDGDGSRFAWAENVGWINAEPSGNGGPGVQVGDSELSGWMYGENVGWISLSCQNTLSCATEAYGVTNDGAGNLAGYAWSENLGWISFSCANTASCGTGAYGVTIDPATGIFSGYAWGENAGWLSFNCTNTASCGSTSYRVKSGWTCAPPPAAPVGVPMLELARVAAGTLLSWKSLTGATGHDVVRGDLGSLRGSGGDFSVSTGVCLADNRTTTALVDPLAPGPGQGVWYLVRGQNCGGNGDFDTGPSQPDPRGAEIAASGNDCP